MAVHLGARLPTGRRKPVVQRLSELTGLPAQLSLDNDLRVTDATFFAELLRDEGKIVGRLESRTWNFDPGIEALLGFICRCGARRRDECGVISRLVNSKRNYRSH